MSTYTYKFSLLLSFLMIFFTACNSQENIRDKQIVDQPGDIDAKAEDIIAITLQKILSGNTPADSLKIKNPGLVQEFYKLNASHPVWTTKGSFQKHAESFLKFINQSRYYGLFPSDYYDDQLNTFYSQLTTDTAAQSKLDAAKWAYSDLLFTSAFIQVVKDLKVGRLVMDSVIIKDSTLNADFFVKQFEAFQQKPVQQFASALEPVYKDYAELKKGLGNFLSTASFKPLTLVKTKDSTMLVRLVYKRLTEEDSLKLKKIEKPDSVTVANAIKKYQKLNGLKVSGKISSTLIKKLNESDKENFLRIAITLDRFKILEKLPKEYIWVNIPSFYLQVRKNDSVQLLSRIICGKPITSTPIITSAITDMITYPQWTIPTSIIKKEILPGLKKDPGYIIRKGYSLVDVKGNEVDPYSVDWSKYEKGIPYKVVQGSGDDNALGVLKFNFPNKFSVYLHDTNQRYLFSNTSRALSHGCVRVQEWKKLAYLILRRDSMLSPKATPIDSLNSWLHKKKKRVIPVSNRLPLFIRYFGSEGKNGKVVFYEDIYSDDKRLREKYFGDK